MIMALECNMNSTISLDDGKKQLEVARGQFEDTPLNVHVRRLMAMYFYYKGQKEAIADEYDEFLFNIRTEIDTLMAINELDRIRNDVGTVNAIPPSSYWKWDGKQLANIKKTNPEVWEAIENCGAFVEKAGYSRWNEA